MITVNIFPRTLLHENSLEYVYNLRAKWLYVNDNLMFAIDPDHFKLHKIHADIVCKSDNYLIFMQFINFSITFGVDFLSK